MHQQLQTSPNGSGTLEELHADLLARYRDLQAYVGWSDRDVFHLRAVHPHLQPSFAAIIDDFYDIIGQHADAAKVITGGKLQVERLKGTLRGWLDDLFQGPYDDPFILRRYRVGERHVEIGLAPYYVNVALARIRRNLISNVQAIGPCGRASLTDLVASINRVLDLDLAIIEYAYHLESTAREQRQARLATLGKVAGGIAHELRNPLNAIKTSVYFLLNARQVTPEKHREHLERIDRQVGVSDRVITALSDFARLPAPDLRPSSVADLVKLALDPLTIPSNVLVSIETSAVPSVSVDVTQMAIVISNLIRNACDAMPDGGQLSITASQITQRLQNQDDVPAVVIRVTDSGCGMNELVLSRITEPLYSTKSRGLGLGLALARDIVQKHGGELKAESEAGVGSTFTVSLPLAVSHVR